MIIVRLLCSASLFGFFVRLLCSASFSRAFLVVGTAKVTRVTKSGFVYVISNIGSFGERVFKIGMTRRMEPMDRIDELSDAPVPFPFDLHAMLYSDNAPGLETALHKLVQDGQVNLVNPRKEFYQNVDLAEIEAFVKARGLSAQFIKYAEAKQYRGVGQSVGRRPEVHFHG
jgi:T5orf172 domain-containing protein